MAALTAALILEPSVVGAAEPRQPLRPWTVDYGDTACSALTTYGSAEKPITFALRPSPHGKSMQIMVVRQGPPQDPQHLPATVAFADRVLETTALRYTTASGKAQMVSMSFPREAIDPLRAAPSVNLAVRGLIEEGFALPRIQSVFRQLDHCQADLQTHWNISEAVTATFKSPAVSLNPLESYVTSDDYPAQALSDRLGGTARVTLMVDAEGRLKDCRIEETSGVASLDAMTCIVLARARFRPARDASDRPVRSVLTSSMTWRMNDSIGAAAGQPARPTSSGSSPPPVER